MTKYHYAVFRSEYNNKTYVIDLWKKRMDDLRKKLQAWAAAVSDLWVSDGVKKCFVTLTYDTQGTLFDASEWSPNHITGYLKALKRRSGVEVLAYAWVVEVQARGVPHYHIVLLYRGSIPFPDKSGMWKYGMSNIKFKLRSPFYLVKYTGKKHQKDFSKLPEGARAYGCSIYIPELAEQMRVLLLPPVIRERYLQEGKAALMDLVKPSFMRSSFVGLSVSRDFAEFIAKG